MSTGLKKLFVWLMVFVTVVGAIAVFMFTTPNFLTAKRVKYTKGSDNVTVKTTVIKEAVTFPLNINTATKEDLMEVPGIGEVYAARIIKYREQNGGFTSLEELTDIKGIGEKRLAIWREYLCCE